jgi:hypothetical protein
MFLPPFMFGEWVDGYLLYVNETVLYLTIGWYMFLLGFIVVVGNRPQPTPNVRSWSFMNEIHNKR